VQLLEGQHRVRPNRPRTGVSHPDSTQECRDLAAARAVLVAAAAAAAACRLDDVGRLRELRALALGSDDSRRSTTIDRFVRDEARFDLLLAELSGNQSFVSLLHGLLQQFECWLRLGADSPLVRSTLIASRAEIVALVLAGDADRAGLAASRRAHVAVRLVLDAVRIRDHQGARVVALRASQSG
jgi:DNA-binding GntR family transcriptional regulator